MTGDAVKENKDLFQKRGQVDFLSRPAAAITLFTLQTFAPAGGAGNRVSLRGGGPMTTLVAPPMDDSLWRLLWLNTPPADEYFEPPQEEKDRVFPWLAPTFVSDGKPERRVAPSAERAPWTAHSLQAFWGMPRRIRLVFAENEQRVGCPLSGVVDDVVVTGFRARPRGVSYDVSFRHPLSPYYAAKGRKDEPQSWLPVHPQPGGVPYKDWPSLTTPITDEAQPAAMTMAAQERLAGLDQGEARLLACGYDMDKMKARGFVEAQMPLFILPEEMSDEARAQLRDRVLRDVDAADIAASAAGIAIRTALAGERAESKATPFSAMRESFFQDTEREFYNNLYALFHAVVTLETPDARKTHSEAWLAVLRKAAQSLFEEAVDFNDMPAKIMERAVPARRNLIGVFLGYGALGKRLFTALELAPPAPVKRRQASGTAK